MPKLHAHIGHVTSVDPISPQPGDVIEPTVDKDEHAGPRLRKRRRIETIANKYIKLGRVPLIVSAQLRGPLNNGWKNPWIKTPSETINETLRSENAQETGPHGYKRSNPARFQVKQTEAGHANPASSIPSPETSRRTDFGHDSVLPSERFNREAQVSPGNSGATQSFGVGPDPSVTFDNSESNPFWLRRPQLDPVGFGSSVNGNHNTSPTRVRYGNRPIDKYGNVELVTPRQPMRMSHSNPGLDPAPEPDWKSSGSASMIITSPVKPMPFISHSTEPDPPNERRRTCSGQPPVKTPAQPTIGPTISADQTSPGQSRDVDGPRLPTPGTRNARNSSSVIPSDAASQSKIVAQDQKTMQLVSEMQESGSTKSQRASTSTSKKNKKKHAKDSVPSVRHDHVTSPTLASSTGFVYRKLGDTRRPKSSSRSKPRPVTFSSPEVNGHQPVEAAEQEPCPDEPTNEQPPIAMTESARQEFRSSGGRRAARPDVYTVPGSPREAQESYRTNCTSDFSTQAAFMMAQLEFQEGTMPSTGADHLTPWLDVEHDTPQQEPMVPSPAFTPFHKFNATLEEDAAESTIAQEMPISTQDLFATVSPFALSTVKKSTKLPASNLRFAVFASGGLEGQGGAQSAAKSPTPAERVPLKNKNTRVSFRSSQSGKESEGDHDAQDSTLRPSKAVAKAVELPQLDFHTSLDDLRRNSDLHFTDRFLLNLNDVT